MDELRVEELEKNIAAWQEELNNVWKGKDTDSAEAERRNLKDLINNAEREINELKGITKTEENEQNPKELLEQLKKEKETKVRDKITLERHLDRLEEERENYESKKNTSYKDIYEEYTAQIDEIKEKLEKMEKEEKKAEIKDSQIKVLTKGRMDVEKEIKEIQKEIRRKQQEIQEIEYGTDDAMEEKELSDGTKVKVPKVNRFYQEMDELKKALKEKESLRDEFQQYIDELKGIEKEEKTEYTEQQNQEYIKYFHGQGNVTENTRDDTRANDEYFGFEKNRKDRRAVSLKDSKGRNPKGKDSNGKDPNGENPNEKDSKGKNPNSKDSSEKNPNGEDSNTKDPNGKDLNGKSDDFYPPAVVPEKDKFQPPAVINNLPIRSFWEIYDSTCTQHVGSIANAINKVAHMKILPPKDEDTLQKALNVSLIPFKAAMKIASFIPNKIMRTDRKIAEMQENIDELSDEDFQVLVQSPEKVNEMFGTHVKDTFDRDYLDPQFMKQYKVNNAYLDVVRSRLGRERVSAINLYNQQAINAETRMRELDEVGEENWTPEQETEYRNNVAIYQQSVEEGKKFQAELDAFDEGAKKKSSSYRNISGWFLAKFNPDNREQNAEMAELSKARREAAQIGDATRVASMTGKMKKKARENTKLVGRKKKLCRYWSK